MAKVQPVQDLDTGPREGDATGRGNGCCCRCCGASPGLVPLEKLAADGGKAMILDDGRVVEYFVYGSDKPDAKVLLQCPGSMGTGWFFAQVAPLGEKLKELNVKGISITRPGVAFSSMNLGCNLLYWAQHDVAAVLDQERVDRFYLEGVSQGSGEALTIAYALHERVVKLHVIVPMVPCDFAQVELPHAVRCANEPGGYPYTAKGMQSCAGCCCTGLKGGAHCPCACACCCFHTCSKPDDPKADTADPYTEKHVSVSGLQMRDMYRNNKHHGGGYWLWAMGDEFGAGQWGYDLRLLKARFSGNDKVLVSFCVDDKSSHPDWARYLIKLLGASYQVGEGKAANPPCKDGDGHSFWQWRQFKGLLAEQLLQLEASDEGPACVNSYWGAEERGEPVPLPPGLCLEVNAAPKQEEM